MSGVMSSKAEEHFISAGDLEKYGYCPLSWWLSKDEVDSELLEEGTKKHEELGAEISKIKIHEEKVKEMDTGIFYFSVGATIVSIIGLTFIPIPLHTRISQILAVISLIWLLASCYYLYRAETIITESERLIAERLMLGFAMVATVTAIMAVTTYITLNLLMSYAVESLALAWLIGASIYLYKSLKHMEEAIIYRKKHDIEGDVKYVDIEDSKPKLFISKKYGLRGRPDFVVLVDDNHIPVEVKTGRVPRGPLFSHILQLDAYCLLMEEEYGKMPPYGVLRYGNVEHEIEYNNEMKSLVIGKLEEMRKAKKAGVVHRNHNRPGKCRFCSRKEICSERLA